jgi:uncharacterized lipoprotein YajG
MAKGTEMKHTKTLLSLSLATLMLTACGNPNVDEDGVPKITLVDGERGVVMLPDKSKMRRIDFYVKYCKERALSNNENCILAMSNLTTKDWDELRQM